jgi:hypothetical protein
MKTLTLTLAAMLAVTAAAQAEPVHKEYVAADAKWLLHLDVDQMLQTDVGKWFGEEILDKQFAKAMRDLKQNLGIDFNWRDIRSVTAYGTQFKAKGELTGVLVIEGYDVGAALDQAISRLEQAAPGGKLPLQKTQEGNDTVFSLQEKFFGAALPGNVFLLSQSKDELKKARDVVSGTSPCLPAKKVPVGAKSAFVFGQAEQLENAPLPPQAQGLKAVEGAQLLLGQQAESVFLKLALTTKDVEAATQMQQALQGLLALATLNQPQDKNTQKLAEAAKVSGADKVVTVKLELPSADVIEMVKQGQKKKTANPDQPTTPRRKKRATNG